MALRPHLFVKRTALLMWFVYANDEETMTDRSMHYMCGIPMKRLGCENWTDADFDEDERRRKISHDFAINRDKVMVDNGWVFRRRYCSHDRTPEYVQDPFTGEHFSFKEAYAIQQRRIPGCFGDEPVFDDWLPPASTHGLLDIGKVEVMPMKVPSGLIFYLDYVNGFEKVQKVGTDQ